MIPPLGPVKMPAPLATSSLAAIPAEITTMSTLRLEPSANSMVSTVSSPVKHDVFFEVWTVISIASILLLSNSPPLASNCRAISIGANSTTCVFIPRSLTAFAASKPNSPPPITAAAPLPPSFEAKDIMLSRSSIVRYTNIPCLLTPSILGTKGEDPVAKTNLSY